MTGDLQQRLADHNRGAVRSTARRRPLRVTYTEEYDNEREAMDRERFLKSGKGRRLLDQKLRSPPQAGADFHNHSRTRE